MVDKFPGSIAWEYRMVVKSEPITWFDPKDSYPMYPNFKYETIRVPVGLPDRPYIGRGKHRTFERQNQLRVGCTMEMVSALAGERWTDHPMTADPDLTRAMIHLNDVLPDDARQKMLEFVPRLLGTYDVPSYNYRTNHFIESFQEAIIRLQSPYITESEIAYLLKTGQYVLDQFDHALGRPRGYGQLNFKTFNQLMMALAA